MAVFVSGCSSLPFGPSSNEGKLKPFLGEASMELQQVFKNQRYPNVVVAADGTLVAVIFALIVAAHLVLAMAIDAL